MKEINFNVIKKVKEYPWYYFKKKDVYHVFQIKNNFGFTNINSTNLGDYSFEIDNSEPFYVKTYQDIKPGYSYNVLTRDRYYIEDIQFLENSLDEYQLRVSCIMYVITDYIEYGKWTMKCSYRKEVPFVNEMKKYIKIKLLEESDN